LDTPQQLPCTSVPHLLPYCALVPFVPHRHFQQFVPTRDCLYSTVGISPACTADLFIPWIGGVNLLSSCDLSPLARVVYSYFSRWTTWRIYVDLNFGECLINDLLDIAKKQIRCHINFQKIICKIDDPYHKNLSVKLSVVQVKCRIEFYVLETKMQYNFLSVNIHESCVSKASRMQEVWMIELPASMKLDITHMCARAYSVCHTHRDDG
jgi:hypothetical protein